MKKGEWKITLWMNRTVVTKVEVKSRTVAAVAVTTPVPHGQPFTIPIDTEVGEVCLHLEVS